MFSLQLKHVQRRQFFSGNLNIYFVHPKKIAQFSIFKVGFLVPLNKNLEEAGDEIPKIPISEGSNVVGRNCVPIADKRLSRKHLSLNAYIDGSADIFVDGTNPVVIRMNNERKKLLSGEKWRIGDGDLIELIPGHYFFKYVVVKDGVEEKSPKSNQKRCYSEASSSNDFQGSGTKKIRQGSEEEPFLKSSKNERQNTCAAKEHSSDGIRHFKITGDTLPLTFRLMRVQQLPPWANTNSVSISDVIEGDIQVAILSNYMVDLDWLISACPALREVPHVLVIHGEGDGKLEYMKRMKTSGWILHKPPLPISYGTHHSKAMFLIYPRGVRIIVHTANLIYVDWNNKSQGLWMQDFPWKDEDSSIKGCGFESDLIEYLGALKWPEFTVNLPGVGIFNINPHFFRKFDYSRAMVRLIASVPGYHSGSSLKKWGHMKLRTVLHECTFDSVFQKSPLVYQFSSLGSIDEKWMAELTASMSAGVSEDTKPLGLGQPSLIWPTVEDVRCSIEGYAAGSCIPSAQKNVEKDFLNKYWAKWKASHSGRCRAMPHIKTFMRYSGQNIAWFLLTSSNLSKAAWGALQKNNSQLMIRSYELGVLFLPASVKYGSNFSCTRSGKSSSSLGQTATEPSEMKRTKFVTLACQVNSDSRDTIQLPIPYELPPEPYSSGDVPWSWDRRYTKRDVYGQVWPIQ